MKTLIEGVGFSQRAHFDCTEQALEVTLRFRGCELEDILFDEWRFNYWKADRPDGEYIVNPGGPMDLTAKFQSAGIRPVACYRDTPEAAMDGIKHLVMAEEPVPVWVDPYYLLHYAKKNRRHTVHSVVVVGFDDEQETVHIVDPSPWQLFRGEIPASDLMAALNSEQHSDRTNRNAWVEFTYLEQWRPPDAMSVRRVLNTNATAMLDNANGVTSTRDMATGTNRAGIPGIRSFARDVATWPAKGMDILVAHLAAGRSQLQEVARWRYGHSCYLASAANRLGDTELGRIATELAALAEAWFLPANMMFKGSKSRGQEMAPRLSARLAGLADREEELLVQIRRLVEAH